MSNENTDLTFPTSKVVTVEVPTSIFVRPSRKNPDTVVLGVDRGGERKRAVLVRVTDEGVRIRTLDGNPREASSNTATQSVVEIDFADLTDEV